MGSNLVKLNYQLNSKTQNLQNTFRGLFSICGRTLNQEWVCIAHCTKSIVLFKKQLVVCPLAQSMFLRKRWMMPKHKIWVFLCTLSVCTIRHKICIRAAICVTSWLGNCTVRVNKKQDFVVCAIGTHCWFNDLICGVNKHGSANSATPCTKSHVVLLQGLINSSLILG
jgi:hypothetical protein